MTTIGNLLTCYGSLDMGVAMAIDPAARVAQTSDVEPGPCKPAAVRWPDTPNLGDITQINWADVEPEPTMLGDQSTRPALRAAERVAGDLADLGYDCRWQVIRASDAKPPHPRHPHAAQAENPESAHSSSSGSWDYQTAT